MKVLVIDSTGLSDITDRYRHYFAPHIKLVGHEPSKGYKKTASGPHGYQCGYYAGVLLNLLPDEEHELHFARIFDQNSNWILGSENFILDILDKVRPDIVSNSWGQHHGKIERNDKQGRRDWAAWAMRFRKLVNEIGCVSFFASGNDDKNDPIDDVAFPQKIIPETANIIGSHNRSGKPSKFSGDGVGVQVTFWGERMMLLNQDGQWEVGSGTSFACPKAAGLCAYLKLSHYKWRQYVLAHATRPDQWSGYIPHPKWGYGSLEYRYQELLAELPDELQPPLVGRRKVMYMDMERVK